jgi:protein-tyrosine kinase
MGLWNRSKKEVLPTTTLNLKDESDVSLPYTARYDKSVVAEAFKILRTNLQFTIKFNEPRVILISSPSQGEGKTTIASNLGVTFAYNNYKTLLLDADMRIPNLHRQFNMDNSDGLSNCLNGDCDLDSVIQKTPVENLDLLASGPIPPNSSELLASEGMLKMMEVLKKHYQIIIIDSPPVNIVADASIVSSLVDGVLMIISAGSTRRKDLSRALSTLDHAHIAGLVLNVGHRGNQGNYYRTYYNRYYNRYTAPSPN